MFAVWEAAIAAYVAGIKAQSSRDMADYMAEMNKNADAIDIEATEVKPRLEIENTTPSGCNGPLQLK